MDDLIVEVKQGKLKGSKYVTERRNKECFSFTCIPFAEPPTGELRFKAPQPPKPWQGVRDATIQAPPCAQVDEGTGAVIGTEDCLYLNIFTPKVDEQKLLPVMFFVHGGGYIWGDMLEYGPDFLIEEDVVFVATQYRLDIFGFLNLDMPEAQGNMGLKDQVQALRWVNENISKFGGDPNNVTIFGYSAGGASVEYLTISPLAKGLFHKAIAHSGSTLNHWTINRYNDAVIERICELSEIKTTDKKELYNMFKNMPSEELLKISSKIYFNRPEWGKGGFYFGFVPTIEKKFEGYESFITESTMTLLKRGDFTKVPYMTGLTRREGLLMYKKMIPRLESLLKNKNLVDELPFDLDSADKTMYDAKLKSIYFDSLKQDDYPDAPVVDFMTDVDFLGGLNIAIKLIAKHNNFPTYFYEFAYDGSYNFLKLKREMMELPGAAHADDCGYLTPTVVAPEQGTPTDDLVRTRLVEMWTNFAKYGNPTPNKTETIPVIWPPVKENSVQYLVIDKELSVKENIAPHRTSLYEELYDKYWK